MRRRRGTGSPRWPLGRQGASRPLRLQVASGEWSCASLRVQVSPLTSHTRPQGKCEVVCLNAVTLHVPQGRRRLTTWKQTSWGEGAGRRKRHSLGHRRPPTILAAKMERSRTKRWPLYSAPPDSKGWTTLAIVARSVIQLSPWTPQQNIRSPMTSDKFCVCSYPATATTSPLGNRASIETRSPHAARNSECLGSQIGHRPYPRRAGWDPRPQARAVPQGGSTRLPPWVSQSGLRKSELRHQARIATLARKMRPRPSRSPESKAAAPLSNSAPARVRRKVANRPRCIGKMSFAREVSRRPRPVGLAGQLASRRRRRGRATTAGPSSRNCKGFGLPACGNSQPSELSAWRRSRLPPPLMESRSYIHSFPHGEKRERPALPLVGGGVARAAAPSGPPWPSPARPSSPSAAP
jgi:hypothetical protein